MVEQSGKGDGTRLVGYIGWELIGIRKCFRYRIANQVTEKLDWMTSLLTIIVVTPTLSLSLVYDIVLVTSSNSSFLIMPFL